MTDEEYYAMKRKKKREDLLNRLQEASKEKTQAIVKPEPKKKESPIVTQKEDHSIFDEDGKINVASIQDLKGMTETNWDNFVSHLEEASFLVPESPIDDITLSNIVDLRLNTDVDDEDRYKNMFKEEIAMISEVLKGLKEQSKYVGNRLKAMSGKGSGGGAPKSYSDLVSAYTSLEKTKLDAIKSVSDLKAKREDFRLKDLKTNPEGETGVDELVDQYYNSMMSGNRKEFLAASRNYYSPLDEDQDRYQRIVNGDATEEERNPNRAGFNLSQGLPSQYQDEPDDDDQDADPYGYIRNENKNVDIVIQRFSSGRIAFGAIDEDGEFIDDYEIPADDVLDSIRINPGSKYAYDGFGRKYKVVDIDTGGMMLDEDC